MDLSEIGMAVLFLGLFLLVLIGELLSFSTHLMMIFFFSIVFISMALLVIAFREGA